MYGAFLQAQPFANGAQAVGAWLLGEQLDELKAPL